MGMSNSLPSTNLQLPRLLSSSAHPWLAPYSSTPGLTDKERGGSSPTETRGSDKVLIVQPTGLPWDVPCLHPLPSSTA